MVSIWKFNLDTVDEQEINVPAGAEFLTVQVQNGSKCHRYFRPKTNFLHKENIGVNKRCGWLNDKHACANEYIRYDSCLDIYNPKELDNET